jgi:hypothetical protein
MKCPLECKEYDGWIKVPWPVEMGWREPMVTVEEYQALDLSKQTAWTPCPLCHPNNPFEGKGVYDEGSTRSNATGK